MTASLCNYTRGVTFRLMSAKCLALKPSKLSLMGAFLKEYLISLFVVHMNDEDKDYYQAVQFVLEEKADWNIKK